MQKLLHLSFVEVQQDLVDREGLNVEVEITSTNKRKPHSESRIAA